MSEPDKPLYVGSAREIQRDGKASFLAIEIDLGELREKLKEEHKRVYTTKDGKVHKVARLICAPMKPENQTEYKTHSLKIDTWKPDSSKRNVAESNNSANQSDIPF